MNQWTCGFVCVAKHWIGNCMYCYWSRESDIYVVKVCVEMFLTKINDLSRQIRWKYNRSIGGDAFFCSFWRRACNEQHKMRLMISVFRRTHWLVGTIFKWPNIEFEPFNVMNYPIISEIMIILAVWHESFEFANHTKSSHLPFKWLCTLEKKDCSTITDRPITFIEYTQIFTFLIKYAANKNLTKRRVSKILIEKICVQFPLQ